MKKFQKSLTLLDSLICKIERNYGVTTDADNTLDAQMQEKYKNKSNTTSGACHEQKFEAVKCTTEMFGIKPDAAQAPKFEATKCTTEMFGIKPDAPEVPQFEATKCTTEMFGIKPESAATEVPKPAPKPKGEKKDNKKKADAPAAPVNELVELFKKCELRVGHIDSCQPVADSEKLYASKVSLGDHQRTILSGIRKHVPLPGMSGKVIVFANLKPRPLAGQVSEGMLLCAESQDETIVELLRPHPDAKVGDIVSLVDTEGSIAPEYKPPNSKAVTAFLEKLNTDGSKTARFGDYVLGTSGQPLTPTSIAGGKIK